MAERNKDIIELRSEEVQELMGQIPPWILRWGITIVVVLLLGLLAGSCFFKYPDTLTAEIIVTTATPPSEIYAMTTGKLACVNVVNFQHVDAGDVLAVVESTADYRDVEYVNNFLRQWNEGALYEEILLEHLQKHSLSLGDIQPVFGAFINALNNYIHHHKEQYYPNKIDIQSRTCKLRNIMNQERRSEFAIHRQQISINTKIYRRDSTLYAQKLISEEDFNNAEQNYMQSRQITISDSNTKSQMRMEQLHDKEAMLDLKRQYWQEKVRIETDLVDNYEQLSNAVKQYKKNYVLRTPIAGKVNMMGCWTANQFVDAGSLLVIVLPEGKPVSAGRAKLPAAGSGKVRTGQTVKVRLANFPDSEYGHVKGQVTAVSAIPDKDCNYFLEIGFPDGLHTNYGKTLPPMKQMVGSAEIIVKDKRLIENLLEPIKKFLSD